MTVTDPWVEVVGDRVASEALIQAVVGDPTEVIRQQQWALRPVWLLDVDGVINVTRPGWGAPPQVNSAFVGGQTFRLRWAPALVARIRSLVARRRVAVRWCTTWCDQAGQLERMWHLPPLGNELIVGSSSQLVSEAKLAAARRVIAHGRRLIWTDDVEVPVFGPLYDELTRNGQGLLIRPSGRIGLQSEHIDAIEKFCTIAL